MNDQPASVDPQVLDIYKLAVEMADQVSSRRATANAFSLTVNTGLVAVAGLFPSNSGPWALRTTCLADAILMLCWFLLLRNYREFNEAKFKVINTIEHECSPVQPFRDEWIKLGNSDESISRIQRLKVEYKQLGDVEKYVPLVYVALYVVLECLGAQMNYIECDIELIRQQIPDGTEVPVRSEALFRAYAILIRAKEANTCCEDVHDTQAAWISETDPDHETAHPFDQLDAEIRSTDAPFLQAIIRAARVKQQESQAQIRSSVEATRPTPDTHPVPQPANARVGLCTNC